MPRQKPADAPEGNDLLKQIGLEPAVVAEPVINPNAKYFVGFAHTLGRRSEELPVKVWATNDVASDRKLWSDGNVQGLKTHCAVYCPEGNATEVVKAFGELHKLKQVKKTDWFTVSKNAVDEFANKLTTTQCEIVTEAKAKSKKK